MKKKTIYLLSASALLLTGCSQYETFLNKKTQSVESEVVQEGHEVDVAMPANIEEIEAAYNSFDYLELGDLLYQSTETFQQIQPGFELTVDELTLYEVTKAEDSLERDFNYANEPSGLILVHTTIENTTAAPFYLTVDELTQSYVEAESFATPSSNAYPLLHGNLRDILLDRQGKVEPGEKVSGYLVYGLGKKSLANVLSQGNFYLTVEPPILDLDSLSGGRENTLGRSQRLFLPLDQKNETELKELQSFIPDRLTSEWWGDKEMIAQAQLNETVMSEEDAVEVTLRRAEIADFEPFPAHEDSFENFSNGQVIVSIEYDVTNHSNSNVLPVDGIATLYINEDPILSDYVLLNELYGLELEPGETTTLVKSFALDKMYYQENWQDHPITIEINIPTTSQEEVEEDGLIGENYALLFDWTPQLILRVTEDLKLEHATRSDHSIIQHLESQVNDSSEDEEETEEEGDE